MNKHSLQPFGALLLLIGGLSLSACSNEEMPMDDGRVALQVTSGIQTRAFDNQWEKEDKIGIFSFTQGDAPAQTYTNVRYVTTGGNGSFTPDGITIYLPTDGSSLDFVAYYPYKADLADGVYTVDVTDQSDQGNIDLMAAGVETTDRISHSVAFNFKHKLSKVVFTFQAGEDMTVDELAGMTVQLTGQQTKATFDVTQPDGEVSVTTGNPVTLNLKTSADGTSAEGIVLPSDDYSGMTLHLVLANKASYFNWDLNGSEAEKFEAGKKYVYDITVNKTRLSITSKITNWEPGNGENGESGNAY